jgi:hypothetical protein
MRLAVKQLIDFELHLAHGLIQHARIGQSSGVTSKHVHQLYLLQVSHFQVRVVGESVLDRDSFEFNGNVGIREVINLVESLRRYRNFVDVKCLGQ